MTRYEQWLRRREKQLRRWRRLLNASPRVRGVSTITGQHTKRNKVPVMYTKTGFLVTHPALLAKTFKAYHRGRTVDARAVFEPNTGYANPPHAADALRLDGTIPPNTHLKSAILGFAFRDVEALHRENVPVTAEKKLAYKALMYFRRRQMYPTWDPYHRSPVENPSRAVDATW
jgi:hypothetical protein